MKIINKIKLRLKFIITTIKLYKARWEVKEMIREMERMETRE